MKVMALDGNSLVYRAFFALPDTMATASGEVTNAVFGFCSMFAILVKDHEPDAIVVVFDRKEKTFRHEAAPEYKAQREKQPDTLYQQLEVVKNELLPAAGVTTLECAGFEGDDIIATIANSIGAADELIIVTGDRDAYQLVRDPNVRVLYNKRGVSDYALYDEAGIKERTGVSPAQYAQYAALRGDPSDNLEGVPGVGEKTAAKLMNQYGSLDSVFDHADEQTPKLKASLKDARDRVLRNADLMRLRSDVPIAIDAKSWTPKPRVDALRSLFARLEFSSMATRWKPLTTRFGGDSMSADSFGGGADTSSDEEGAGELVGAGDVAVTVEPATLDDAILMLERDAPLGLAVVWTGDPGRSEIRALVACADAAADATTYTCRSIGGELVANARLKAALSRATNVVMHDARNAMRAMLAVGIDLQNLCYDTAIAAYLADSGAGAYDTATVAQRWLARRVAGDGTTANGQFDFDAPTQDAGEHAAACDAVVALLARPVLGRELDRQGVADLYVATELPLVRVLAKMEHAGIAVDAAALKALETSLGERSGALVATLHTLAGKEFNVNSTKQLKEILFEERGLTGGKKTKATKGYSTDAASLEKIRDEWPDFIDALMEYREVEKLRATYALGLLHSIGSDGRIHASFNQTVARTGRLSSDQPNLHNIPIRSESGKVFRDVFVPADRHEFLVADYNQIELRCIAHLAQDPGLLGAFNEGLDIHRATAAQVFGVPLDDVTSEQRSKAKMVSYGLAYGMEAYGLSQRLGIDVGEAKVILDAYFTAFPRVKKYMDDAVARATKDGYTTTLFGRRRRIEGIHSPIRQVQAAAARMAMNAGIQGLAADIFKIALVAIDRRLEEDGLASRLVLQVHDEVIVEVAPGEHDRVEEVVLNAMHGAATLDVPLVVNAAWGASWAAAKVA
ncbi:MAG: DNA polymerase I [Ilumatobacteraceae bacterium]